MNEREGLNLLDYLPTGIDKSDPVIQAIFSDFEGDGAIAYEVEELIGFIDYYTRTDDVRNHRAASLEMIVKLFAGLKRQIEEKDPRLLRRMLALTERKGDTVWGNALDIKHIFETYFLDIKAYVCENTDDENLLEQGDFEEEGGWQFTGGSSLEYKARFSEKHGLFLDGEGTCFKTQEGEYNAGVYTFHFFLKGTCGLVIQNEAGQYWNADEKILAWSDDEVINSFEKPDWGDVFCFIVFGETAQQISFKFTGLEGKEACIDYARFFRKPLNPSYTVVIQYEGYTVADKTMHLGAGSEDPLDEVDYAKESYFDHSFIVGYKGAYRNEVYQWLLDMVRPRGIQAFVEFVEKTEVEEDEE